MTRLKSPLWVSVCVFVLAVTVGVGNRSRSVQTQDADRILEIERYPDEPLQLVNLKIGTRSVKEHIKQKFKDNQSKWAIDSVKFQEKDDWIKRLAITLRNASEKPIYGLQGLVFFKPVGFPMQFSLQLVYSKQLRREPLQPGAEIELSVDQKLLNMTLENAKNRGADVRGAVVSFSLEMVIFSDELRWYRGNLVRPDGSVPNKWVPVNQPLALKRNNLPVDTASASFMKAVLRSYAGGESLAPVEPGSMVFSTCTAWTGSFQGLACNGDDERCIQRTDVDDSPNPGLLSHFSSSGLCVDSRDLGFTCTQSGEHSRLQTDPNCQVCPDADGDGFQSSTCGGPDCNDTPAPGSGPSINPNATENCTDGIDNDCDGYTDEADNCDCVTEGPIYQAGGEFDCILCRNTVDDDCDGDTDGDDSGCSWWCSQSPVVIDVSGNGFNLTSAANGVNFDLNADGTRERLSWTATHSDDSWLALDSNGDGAITNGTELFGNFTPQPNPPAGYDRNGFNALAEYDLPAKGGNGDGLITERDKIFVSLLLWQDSNHNGVSEANELHALKQMGLTGIECNYKESKRRDEYGNQFRYAAKVRDVRDTKVGRWAWDVFLVHGTSLTVENTFRPFDWANGTSVYQQLFAMTRSNHWRFSN